MNPYPKLHLVDAVSSNTLLLIKKHSYLNFFNPSNACNGHIGHPKCIEVKKFYQSPSL